MVLRVNLYFHSQDPDDPVERWLLSLPPYRRGALIKRHLYNLAATGQLGTGARRAAAHETTRKPHKASPSRGRQASTSASVLALDQINRIMTRIPPKT